ncbi:hypothetical protein [Nocardioides sp.]|uniref:hypothetical protein n=1 Tax=Nocardioides sp. TaxID=35761 RepID=UPI002736E825|nr:hypothetical protein [Nocardioides sp.]MDP3890504.1 hypothetical protein [Nocardioides sp.]
MELLLTQGEWTHRRAETLSLEAHGETRQRVSWDFTLDPDLAIEASRNRIAVPLATLRKQPLKRLDVSDAGGTALPIWGKHHNGDIATEALVSGLSGVLGRGLSSGERAALENIVFAPDLDTALPYLKRIRRVLVRANRLEEGQPLLALAQDLGENFLLVVEVPADTAGTRSLVKMQYEGDVGEGESNPPLSLLHAMRFEGAAWSSAASWHIEVHAPPGLAVRDLSAHVWDEDNEDVREIAVSPALGHTAHITSSTTPRGALTWAELELRPARAGLVNQTLFGAVATFLLLVLGVVFDAQVYAAVANPDRASAVVAVMLAVPAVLIALLSREQEHGLVSRLLLLPRMVNLLVAIVLLTAAAALVMGLDEEPLTWTLRSLLGVQSVLLVTALVVQGRSVGGDP